VAKRHVVLSESGPPCPRCRRPMQVREHDLIREKHLRQPYYFKRWFYCRHSECKTTLVMREEHKVWNENQDGPLASPEGNA
jgi:hypothetical protein